jgi:hypothetical protein
MKRDEEQGPVYITYTYPEQEFKNKLGISDPNPVLTVERKVRAGEIVVRLMPS